MIITDKDWIIQFLSGKHCDFNGRVYEDILFYDDDEMEKCHDHIQWIFPLHEKSNHATNYPIINKEIVEECKKIPEICENISSAIRRMESFYGFDSVDREKQKIWCKDFDHNLLRITRIIRSSRIFGLEDEADDFYLSSKDAGDYFSICDFSKEYWKKARYEDIYSPLR